MCSSERIVRVLPLHWSRRARDSLRCVILSISTNHSDKFQVSPSGQPNAEKNACLMAANSIGRCVVCFLFFFLTEFAFWPAPQFRRTSKSTIVCDQGMRWRVLMSCEAVGSEGGPRRTAADKTTRDEKEQRHEGACLPSPEKMLASSFSRRR